MKIAPNTVLALCILAGAQAQAEVEQRDLKDFTEIEVSGGIDLELKQGDSFSVEVDSGDVDLDEVITDVRGDNLRIRRDWDDKRFGFFSDFDHDRILVRITLPVLEDLQTSGGSDVEAEGVFKTEEFDLRTSGGSRVSLAVEVDTIDIEASGGSDIRLEGSARWVIARTSGGSELDARALNATNADLRASGSSDTEITVLESIIARASGSSDITYSGDPSDTDFDTSGGADIRHRK